MANFSSQWFANAGSTYEIDNSCRFDDDSSERLFRTFSAGSRTTWTLSTWIKLGKLTKAANDVAFSNGSFEGIRIQSTGFIMCRFANSDLTGYQAIRDPSAWYHLVWKVDTTQSSEADRIRLYINNQSLGFASGSYPSEDATSTEWNTALVHNLAANPGDYGDMTLAETHYIDGTSVAPSSFGEYNNNDDWVPKEYTGGSYGTNGFYLKYGNASALGEDSSGEGHNLSVGNVDATNQLTDSPTNNHCVWNTAIKTTNKPSNGNLDYQASDTTPRATAGTLAVKNSKWYYEWKVAAASNKGGCGWISEITAEGSAGQRYIYPGGSGTSGKAAGMLINGTGQLLIHNGGSATPSQTLSRTVAATDTFQCAFDASTGKIWFGQNNTWFDSSGGTGGNPSTGANATATITSDDGNGYFWPSVGGESSPEVSVNFGQRTLAYTPPTNFNTVCVTNLSDPGVNDPSSVCQATEYSGNGSARAIAQIGKHKNGAGATFQPDLVWIKNRTQADEHKIVDAVRGATKEINSDADTAETTDSAGVTGFNSNGFQLGTGANGYNDSGEAFVAWQWKMGNGTVSNSDGDITSTVSANPSAGFSIVTYTGGGATETVGHGLGVAPACIITKRLNGATNWNVWVDGMINGNTGQVYLDTNAAEGTRSASIAPTSTTWQINSNAAVGGDGNTYVAYVFAPTDGVSAFGRYIGNGNSDGTFVGTGHKPSILIVKELSSVDDWGIYDMSRSGNGNLNVMQRVLRPDTNAAEFNSAADRGIDFYANGFKLKTSNGTFNASAETYLYMSWANSPFKLANAM